VKDLTDAKNKARTAGTGARVLVDRAVKLQLGSVKDAKAASTTRCSSLRHAAPHYAAGLVRSAEGRPQGARRLQKRRSSTPRGRRAARVRRSAGAQGPDVLPKAIAEYEAFLVVSQSEADVNR